MNPREKRTETIALRVEPALKEAIAELADREHRTISQQVHKWIVEALRDVRSNEPPRGRRKV